MRHMLHTYHTMASFSAKMKYFSLDNTFNIDRVRPVKRTSLYLKKTPNAFFPKFCFSTYRTVYDMKTKEVLYAENESYCSEGAFCQIIKNHIRSRKKRGSLD